MEEFGLEPEFLEAAGLSLADRQAMLTAHDQIQTIEVALPDTNALNDVRERLVKKMVPITSLSSWIRKDNLPKLMEEYEAAVNTLLANSELNPHAVRDFQANEELLRLSALNERLKTRKKVARVGAVALTGAVTLIMGAAGAGGGAVVEQAMAHDLSLAGPVLGALVGSAAGAILGRERIRGVKQGSERSRGFDADSSGEYIYNQVAAEKELADRYLRRISGHD
jgi:hypothetical protein